MTALLFDGKNIAEPIPEIADATNTTHRGVSSRRVRYPSVARINITAPEVARRRAPYRSESLPMKGERRLPTTYPGSKEKGCVEGREPPDSLKVHRDKEHNGQVAQT